MTWLRRLYRTLFSRAASREFDEEVRFHIDTRTDDHVRSGMSVEEARREAVRRFGSVTLARERVRDVEALPGLAEFARDASFAVRTFRRNPGFTLAALATLTLGIGATVAIFSAVYGVLLRPLPFPAAERLIRVWEEHPGGAAAAGNRWITNRTFYAWASTARTIDMLGAYGAGESVLRVGDEDVRMSSAQVSPGLLLALGARPRLGRLLNSGDVVSGASRVMLLSENRWREHFHGDPRTIGRVVLVNGRPTTVVGVVADRFSFPTADTQVWTPYIVQEVTTDPARGDQTSGVTALARIAAGATIAQVESEGTAIARSVPVTMATRALFGVGGPPILHARSLTSDLTATVQPALLVLAASVALLLLISCVNVANLLLSRCLAREREFAVRAAIGAGRARLVRQSLTESVMLSGAGCVGGIILAIVLLRVAALLAPPRFPRLFDIEIDAYVLAFAAFVSVVTAILVGLVPALRIAHVATAVSLRGGDGTTIAGSGVREGRLRGALLVAESAFAVILLIGAGLLVRSFIRLMDVDTGYSADRVLTARVTLPPGSTPEHADQLVATALSRLRAMDGVTAAGAGNLMPMFPIVAVSSFPNPAPSPGAPEIARAVTYSVTIGYAEALGLRLRAGRFFDERDGPGGIRPMIVNEEFARQYLPGGTVVGRRFLNLFRRTDNGIVTEVVGVVANVLRDRSDQRPAAEIYFPARAQPQRWAAGINVVMRTEREPRFLVQTVRRTLHEIEPTATIELVQPLTDPLWTSVAQPRFAMAVVVAVAASSLLLALIGLYGVLAYAVSQRRREFGVRAALGASRSTLLRLIVRDGLITTGAGAVLGLVGAAGVTRLMSATLFGVTPLDGVAFAAAPLILLATATIACVLPALRAARVGPAEALRSS